MAADPADDGSSWSALQRLAGSVAAVPVTLGFLALGTGVLLGRSLLDVVEHAWRLGSDRQKKPRAHAEDHPHDPT